KQLTIADPAITKSKEYDKTVTANATAGALLGVVTVGLITDDASVTAAAQYNNATVGTGKTITVVYTLAGVDKDNYLKPVDKVYTDGVITAKQLTIADPAITKSKEYDKTVTAAVTKGILSGVVTVGASADDASVTAAAQYNNATVGAAKTITVVYTLAGVDKDNYIKPVDKVYTDGVITVKALTITAKPHTIIYNGTAYSGGNGVIYNGFVIGESVADLSGTLTYAGTSQGAKNADTYKIIPTGLTATNYSINFVEANLVINKAALKIIAGDQTVNFGTDLTKIIGDATFTTSGLLSGDNANAILGTVTYTTNYTSLTTAGSIGIYIEPVIPTMTATNYDLIAEKGTITITAPPSSPVFQIPNAFTPNNDGHNDGFKIIENGYVKSVISFRIYTKSGKMVFSDNEKAWDGRFAGVMLDSDVYIWTAEFINKLDTKENLSGTVLLLK
ncbi:MAG: YDG domain-containing protein, partial [Bacteroidetes bacterium]|nr:YDG domain-containing protein [Bacteroidota bacterium]